MHAQLSAIDPLSAARVHASDMVRVVRALEVHAQTGLALGELRRLHALGTPRYRSLTLVLDVEPQRWAEQLATRTRSMMARGWVDEVRALRERYGPELRPLRSVGYRQIAENLDAAVSAETLHERVLFATRQYGKRQRNWFRSEPSVDQRLNTDSALSEEMLARIEAHIR
jgi:tRNA dimethylallyltransferase